MNGAHSLIRSAAAQGIEVCFANPGTTELAMVDALGKIPSVRCVLGLFEGVCTGAADGYGRMLGRPAATLLHLGPGFANGIANLHNARRARTPILNLIGDHATWHLRHDAPLTSDIRSFATPVSGYFAYIDDVARCPTTMDAAMAASMASAGCISTIVVPTDIQEAACDAPLTVSQPRKRLSGTFDGDNVDAASRALSATPGAVIILGAKALTRAGQQAAHAVAVATGARLYVETFPAKWDRGGNIPTPTRFPYFPEQGIEALKDAPIVLLVGTSIPVAYFGVAGLPSELAPPNTIRFLATPEEDAEGAIIALAQSLGAEPASWRPKPMSGVPNSSAALDPQTVGTTIAALLPENAIAMVEGATSTPPFYAASAASHSHTLMTNTGGAIGQGMPVATGAALACPDRRVVNLEADGSGAYTLQSLWTQAREGLGVITVICANRTYGILRVEFERAGIDARADVTDRMTSLDNPPLDWVRLAQGFGVPGTRATSVEELRKAFSRALAAEGPSLIEAVM